MILLDVNVLVYSHREDMAEHADFAAWLTGLAEGTEPFALCAGSVAGFVRVVTHPRIFVNPTSLDVALRFIEGLTESPACRWVEPGDRWWSIFDRLCQRLGAWRPTGWVGKCRRVPCCRRRAFLVP